MTEPLSLAPSITFARPIEAAITLIVFAVLSIVVTGATALAYRWYFRTKMSEGITILLGVTVVALYLNTASLGAIVGGETLELLTPEQVFFNVVALGVAAAVSPIGRSVGDRLAANMFALSGVKQVEGEVGRMVRVVGRVTGVTLPAAADIKDMESYEPVTAEKKAELAEKTLLFPRRLTTEELRDRLVTRIKQDFGVGYVDVDLASDGSVEYFAVGSRASGLGPTLPPGTAAIAVTADPAYSATPGDIVQVWRTGGETQASADGPESEPVSGTSSRRVATAEIRATVGDVVTLTLDETDAKRLQPEPGYKLVTVPTEPQADKEFATRLRSADETMTAVTIAADSALLGTTVAEIAAVVAAIRPSDGPIQAIPSREYTFTANDTVYLVGRPDTLRRFEAAARGEGQPIESGVAAIE